MVLWQARLLYLNRNYGLAGLSKALLDVQLDKDPAVRCSNWEVDTLSDRQVGVQNGERVKYMGQYTIFIQIDAHAQIDAHPLHHQPIDTQK